MDLNPKWLASEHLTAVMAAGGFKAKKRSLRLLNGLLEGLSSPL
jgi:hypothetical protein